MTEASSDLAVRTLAWVTTGPARGLDEDEDDAVAALRAAGPQVEVVDWDDPLVDWGQYELVVLRSAWDYPERLEEFLSWLDRIAGVTKVVNSPDLVRWSMDKRYLADLESAGVAVVPTVFIAPGDVVVLPAGRFVVKPAVGAGSRDAASYGPGQHAMAHAHVRRLHASGRIVLVQPFLESLARDGEWPLVFFDGRFSHAASKRVALPEAGSVDKLFAQETNDYHVATEEQRTVAGAAMRYIVERFGTPAYGRIDLVRRDDGRYCVLEAELIEPSLFLGFGGATAMGRFVESLCRSGLPHQRFQPN